MTSEPLALTTCIARADGALSATVGVDQAVVLPHGSNLFFGLDDIGRRVWELIESPVTLGEICRVLGTEYDVEQGQCEKDVLVLVQELIDERLAATVDS